MDIPSLRAHRRARIEIIPLIDIIFFLLATFVMVSLSMVKHKGIPVTLPVATTGVPQDRKDHTVITLDKDNKLFINKEPVAWNQLVLRLRRLKDENPDPKIFINGDETAHLGQA